MSEVCCLLAASSLLHKDKDAHKDVMSEQGLENVMDCYPTIKYVDDGVEKSEIQNKYFLMKTLLRQMCFFYILMNLMERDIRMDSVHL